MFPIPSTVVPGLGGAVLGTTPPGDLVGILGAPGSGDGLDGLGEADAEALQLRRLWPAAPLPGSQRDAADRVVGALLGPCRHEIRHNDPDRALAFALRLIDGAVANAIAFDEVGASYGSLDEQELITELTFAVVAYLTLPPSP